MSIIERMPRGGDRESIAEREAMIVQAVRDAQVSYEWAPVTPARFAAAGAERPPLTYHVMLDALRIEGIRVNVTATAAQQVADLLGAVMLTPQMSDQVYAEAHQITPSPQAISASKQAMIDHSRAVDRKVAGARGIVADVGKDWVLVNRLVTSARAGTVAANYGWHVDASPWRRIPTHPAVSGDSFVIQSVGFVHDRAHTDYSQTCRLVSVSAALRGALTDIRTVLQSPSEASILSHEGPLLTTRQPGVTPPVPEDFNPLAMLLTLPGSPFRATSGPVAIVGDTDRNAAALATLHEAIQPLARALLDRAAAAGLPLVIVSAFRSIPEQDRLFASGRTVAGPVVTSLRGGESWHQYGLAFDVAFRAADGVTWHGERPDLWTRIGAMGEAVGLRWGGRFPTPDRPHFEYHPGLTIEDAKAGKRPPVPAVPSVAVEHGPGMGSVVLGGALIAALAAAFLRGRRR